REEDARDDARDAVLGDPRGGARRVLVVPLDERAARVVLEQHLVAEVAQHPDPAVLVRAEGGGGDEAAAGAAALVAVAAPQILARLRPAVYARRRGGFTVRGDGEDEEVIALPFDQAADARAGGAR